MALRRVGFFQSENTEQVVLPVELSINILSRLSVQDLMSVMVICKAFAELGRDDAIWRALFKKYFYVDAVGIEVMNKFIYYYRVDKGIGRYFNAKYIGAEDLLDPVYQLLMGMINYERNDSSHADAIWTKYLLGEMQVKIALATNGANSVKFIKMAEENLLEAAKLGNPIAMNLLAYPSIAFQSVSADDKKRWLEKSHELGFPAATYYLSIDYIDEYIRSNSKNLDSLRKFYEYLIQAANRGYPRASFELAKSYEYSIQALNAGFSSNVIPYGEHEWSYFNWQAEMQKERQKIGDDQNSAYQYLYFQGVLQYSNYVFPAAFSVVEMLAMPQYNIINSTGQSVKEKKSAECLSNAAKFAQTSKEGRRARMLFWYEKAANAGLKEATEKLNQLAYRSGTQ